MSGYTVTPQDITNAAASCTTTAGDVAAQLATLKTYVTNLEAWWQGIAYTTFQELMQEYTIYSTMLNQALTDIASGLNGTRVNYSDSEQANIKTINSIQTEMSSANLS